MRTFSTAIILVATATTAFAQGQRPAAQGQASARTEILTYDNWTVTCRDGRDPKDKRVCSAELTIVQEANGQRRVLFSWLMGMSKDNALTSAMRFLPGVSIQPGLEIRFPEKAARKLPIASCEPTYCEVLMPIDDTFARDATASAQLEAVVIASDGRAVTFTVNLKGFSQALAAIKR
jgi:invasion protein IalB